MGSHVWPVMGTLILLSTLRAAAAVAPAAPVEERLGTVSFTVSCARDVQPSFNRGVALLHDFWYEEARPQFERILKSDPACAMAHWGIAMSLFHEIWDRPDATTLATGRRELEAAVARPPQSAREREYVAALESFYRGESRDYQTRIDAYSAAMGKLYGAHPDDVDAGAFYALALLAAQAPNDTSLAAERRALAVLKPLWAKYPDHPGLVHYIIHACDNPALAAEGLAAARAYGRVAPSGPHAVHMPGHIFARLGMWQEDIEANRASVAASRGAEARHESGSMDQLHSDDFLIYAYLQRGQVAEAQAVMAEANAAMTHFETMPDMNPDHYMAGMFPYYRVKLPIFIDLETRDWQQALALEPIAAAPTATQLQVYWARNIAAGHLRRAAEAQHALSAYDALIEQMRHGDHAYLAEGTGAKIRRGEMLAWTAYADGRLEEAFTTMRESAELQDRVGQGEVDIPAREMLADMLLEAQRSKEALIEYQRSLELSPNRFNGLYGAGQAAETAGDAVGARRYYSTLLKSSDAASTRPELAHARAFVGETTLGRN